MLDYITFHRTDMNLHTPTHTHRSTVTRVHGIGATRKQVDRTDANIYCRRYDAEANVASLKASRARADRDGQVDHKAEMRHLCAQFATFSSRTPLQYPNRSETRNTISARARERSPEQPVLPGGNSLPWLTADSADSVDAALARSEGAHGGARGARGSRMRRCERRARLTQLQFDNTRCSHPVLVVHGPCENLQLLMCNMR